MARAPRSSGDLLADRRFAYAEAAAADGDHEAAADLYEQTAERVPHWAPAFMGLGEARLKRGDRDGAREAFTRAAALDPADDLGARLALAALGAPSPTGMSADFVRDLFDQYAPRFEAHLTGELAYTGPALIRDAIVSARAALGLPTVMRRCLDLGCGTGLMADAITGLADVIDGCDLSPAMVRAAAAKGRYRRVEAAGIEDFLAREPAGAADLVTAADVFVYLGDLSAVFAATRRVLAGNGLFAFTTQSGPEKGYAVGPDRRFAHSRAYLAETLAAAGFSVVGLEAATTRRDAGVPVAGLVAVARPAR